MDYDKLLLTELRLAVYEKGDAELNDALLAKAVTLNENLRTLGYVLAPADLLRIAVSPSLCGFYDQISAMLDTVPAEPMYPGFPYEVMQMSEAVFRFHQLLHYFSTYTLEAISGEPVSRGWLPNEGRKSSTSPQRRVLEAKTLRLLPEESRYLTPFQVILSRRERMTLPEQEIVSTAVRHLDADMLAGAKVGFKENLNTLYAVLIEMEDREAAFRMLRALCQHSGDALRCVDVLLRRYHYHFRTNEKRFLVKLLESYSVQDFRANLILSGRRAERNILLLQYLDYSVYSRSDAHMAAVNALRDGALRSWESTAKSLLAAKDDAALDFIAQRPGMMLRMLAWLLRLGYSSEEVVAVLAEKASALSTQTLVTNLNFFGKLTEEERADSTVLYNAFETLLSSRLGSMHTALRGKKVFIKLDAYDPDVSEIRANEKSAEGGYLRSGIAVRIPQGIDRLRFFVYWNDPERVDVDLHAGYTDLSGQAHGAGWNAAFRDSGVVFSGDITHSDAAEYIDIDLTAPLDRVHANIHLFSGRRDFASVETCYVGLMAVPADADGAEPSALYSEANCFFHHDLRQKCATINYGYIDVRSRCLVFDGVPQSWSYNWYSGPEHRQGKLSLRRYLELLLKAQEAELCASEEEADAVLVMGKAESDKEISLIDENFFMDEPGEAPA